MAREIDLDQKLSKEDADYLYARNRWREVLDNYKRFGGDYEVQIPEGAPVTGPESLVNAAGIDALSPEEQRKYLEQGSGGQSEEEEIPYEDMTVPQLKAELDGRVAEAETDEEKANLAYTAKDNKAQLVAKLDRDDELVAARGE